jgi:hypothetical protein
VSDPWVPPIRLRETPAGCRLSLGGRVDGAGATPQEALDDLVARLREIATAVHGRGLIVPRECGAPDHRWLDFLWRAAERARRGDDLRRLVLDGPADPPARG